MRGFRRLDKSHSGKRGVVLNQLDAGLQFQCLEAEHAGFCPRRSTSALPMPPPCRPGRTASLPM
jgi:hypothetical protein